MQSSALFNYVRLQDEIGRLKERADVHRKKSLKKFFLCTYFFAIISLFSFFAIILNGSSFRPVLVISTDSFTVLSSVILRSFYVVSTVRLCLLFLISLYLVLSKLFFKTYTLFFAIHFHCLLFIITLLLITLC